MSTEAGGSRREEAAMKFVSWIAGAAGIVVALIGVVAGIAKGMPITMLGRTHAPVTFLIVGILLLAIGIWASSVAGEKKQ
jgi:ABC-type antimicrobial peptide transport system permease subunit